MTHLEFDRGAACDGGDGAMTWIADCGCLLPNRAVSCPDHRPSESGANDETARELHKTILGGFGGVEGHFETGVCAGCILIAAALDEAAARGDLRTAARFRYLIEEAEARGRAAGLEEAASRFWQRTARLRKRGHLPSGHALACAECKEVQNLEAVVDEIRALVAPGEWKPPTLAHTGKEAK